MLNLFNMITGLFSKSQSRTADDPNASYTFKRIFFISIGLLSIYSAFFLTISLSAPRDTFDPSRVLLLSTVFTTASILFSLLLLWLFRLHTLSTTSLPKLKKPARDKKKEPPFSLPMAAFWSLAATLLLGSTLVFSYFSIVFFCPEYSRLRIFGMSLLTTLLMDLIAATIAVFQIKQDKTSTPKDDSFKEDTIPMRTVVRWGVCIIGSCFAMFAILFRNLLPHSPWYADPSDTRVVTLALVVTLIIIPLQIVAYITIFQHNKTPMKKFYIFPQVRMGIRFLGLQFLLSLVLMFFSGVVPFEAALTLEVVVIGLAVVLFNLNDITRAVIELQDSNLVKDTNFMRSIQRIADALPALAENAQVKSALEALQDEIRYSDPVGTKDSKALEQELFHDMDRLKNDLEKKNLTNEAIMERCTSIRYQLKKRNSTCLNL